MEQHVPYLLSEDSSDEERTEPQRRRFDVLSTHGTMEEALRAMLLRDGAAYRYLYNYGPLGNSDIYRCASHIDCAKYVHLVSSSSEDEATITLEARGIHTGPPSDVPRSGISILVKREIDAILSGRAGPRKCLKILAENDTGDMAMLRLLPTSAQLKNRKAHLTKKYEGKMKSTTPAALTVWCNGKLCESASEFYGREPAAVDDRAFDRSLDAAMNDLIVLRVFEHKIGDGDDTSFGIVLFFKSAIDAKSHARVHRSGK
ncbi:hypothetical protein V7S43_018304 [Phytophthora oleae]|uniref:Uncharacterized protein n=1 Tax=Phytophthora oleae TaxID=2107226 RepID=A0ABD3EQM7_9STRA